VQFSPCDRVADFGHPLGEVRRFLHDRLLSRVARTDGALTLYGFLIADGALLDIGLLTYSGMTVAD
jgi:hypothetical protein